MVKTAVLVSGGGTNLQAIIDAQIFGEINNCELTAVISSNPEAYALTRARSAEIPTYVVDVDMFPNRASFTEALLNKLRDLDIELVVLAGFMFIIDKPLINAYRNKIINIHPSLIPAFCGDGFYGLRVHQEALAFGVKITGATAHFATEEADAGPIILQKSIEIREDDTPSSLQRRVMEEVEWQIMPRAISLFCEGRLHVDGRVVRITESSKETAK